MVQSIMSSLRWQRLVILTLIMILSTIYNLGGMDGSSEEKQQVGWIRRRLLEQPQLDESENYTVIKVGRCEPSNATGSQAEEEDDMFPGDIFTPSQLLSGAVICHLIGTVYMLYALAVICDRYFVPFLDAVQELCGMTPDVAGATLMAIGSSSPEMFSNLIGVFVGVGDVGIGTIVGSAFDIMLIIAACGFFGNRSSDGQIVKLTAWPLVRDTVFYAIALTCLVCFFLDEIILWWEAMILVLVYVMYVAFMKVNGRAESLFLSCFPSMRPDLPAATTTQNGQNVANNMGQAQPIEMQSFLPETNQTKVQTWVERSASPKDDTTHVSFEFKLTTSKNPKSDPAGQTGKDYQDPILSGPSGSCMSKAIWCFFLPVTVPMWLTIPDVRRPCFKHRLFLPISFIMCIFWITVWSYLLVWWASKVGHVIGIPEEVMGLTFLALGTSIPNVYNAILVSRAGHGDMVISASIGSNIFDITMGLPLPWLLYTAVYQTYMPVSSNGMGCTIVILTVMYAMYVISIVVFRWRMTKWLGAEMLVVYTIFALLSLAFSTCWIVCPF